MLSRGGASFASILARGFGVLSGRSQPTSRTERGLHLGIGARRGARGPAWAAQPVAKNRERVAVRAMSNPSASPAAPVAPTRVRHSSAAVVGGLRAADRRRLPDLRAAGDSPSIAVIGVSRCVIAAPRAAPLGPAAPLGAPPSPVARRARGRERSGRTASLISRSKSCGALSLLRGGSPAVGGPSVSRARVPHIGDVRRRVGARRDSHSRTHAQGPPGPRHVWLGRRLRTLR